MDLFLFLSPHLDDAALSCGGLIKRLSVAEKRVVVATVFTSDLPPGVPPSWLARRNHSAWDAGPFPFAARRMEDTDAMSVLGAEHAHWGYLDAMYRRDSHGNYFYRENTAGAPVVAADETEVVASLRAEFEKIQRLYSGFDLRVFSPLSLGAHVDHVIVRRAAETFWNPARIVYYEDFPYAGRRGVSADWLAGKDSQWKHISVELTSGEVASRINAVLQYASQLRGLFPSFVERIQEIVRARTGLLSGMHLPGNPRATRSRAEASIRNYIRGVGGEKYWFTGDETDLPNLVLSS